MQANSSANSKSNGLKSSTKILDGNQSQYLQKIFGEPCYSKNQLSIKLISRLGPQPKLSDSKDIKIILVTEDMKIKQVVQKWYKRQFKSVQNKKKPDDYMLMYESKDINFPLYDHETVMDFKSRLQNEVNHEVLALIVYEQQFCPHHQNECLMNEQNLKKFQNLHQKSIDIPIKIQINEQKVYYFYIQKVSTTIKIQELNEKIQNSLLANSHPVKCTQPIKYTLWVEKENISHLIQQKLNHLNIQIGEVWKNNRLTLHQKFFAYGLREFCSPSEIITLCFTTPCFKYEAPPAAEDGLIRISCYKINVKDENQQNKNEENRHFLEKRTIERNFSQIKKMKINILLKEEKVQNPFAMSLYLDGQTIRPSATIEEIAKIKVYIEKKQPVNFVCVPDNFLFYQQVAGLSSKETMQDLLKQIPYKKMPVTIYPTSKYQFTTERKSRIERLKQTKGVRDQHREPDFLDPIMVYTSDMICYQLNSFLRETSIALFTQDQIRNKYWHYTASEKIITNLLKLNNYIGTVFRGSAEFDYNCKKGDVLEWSCFTSTSKQIDTARSFIQLRSDAYIFEIKVFTGKQIGKFSMVQTEYEIMILPCTKFKVLEVQQNPQFTYVKMIEIPVPKKIPGKIVVWIDNNFPQNALYFNMFVKDFNLKDFDLMQLDSNQHFIMWLNEFRYILDLPHVTLHFITNMNRSPRVQGKRPEGIETLEIIRSFSQTAKLIYFIDGAKHKWNDLKKAGKDKDPNIAVIEDPAQLFKQLLKGSLK